METLRRHYENNFQARIAATESQNLSSQQSVMKRFTTFHSTDPIQCSKLTLGVLASLGFYHTRQGNIIKCDGCHFEIDLSTTAEDLVSNHMNQSPQCYFAQQNSDLLPINSKPLNKTSELNSSQTNASSDTNSNSVKAFLESFPATTLHNLRGSTFANWPLITPSANDMIAAGWSYTNISDRVICIHCDALYHKWANTDSPYEIHRLKSPHCRFFQLSEKNEINNLNANTINAREQITEGTVGVVQSPYSILSNRVMSFEKWPHSEENPLPSIDSFANAGFYYTGKSTNVRCFYCNGALQNWMKNDDPKVEHARWYPQCDYIRQYIGKDLYEAIRRKNKELKAQQNNSKQAEAWTPVELDRMIKARLDLPAVEKLRNLGFIMAIIRKSFEMQLKFRKDDFKTFNDQYLACLILDLQVKSINGNEANILVPKDWREQFLREQEQQYSRSEIFESEPMETEKIDETSSENSKTCLICMQNERQVACLPCGHFSSCGKCGPTLKICPICRGPVKAFARIYL